MKLLYTNCVPILTYACAVKEYFAYEMQRCNTALNDSIRKIFSYNRWESTRILREQFGYDPIKVLFARAKTKFPKSLLTSNSSVLRHLAHFIPVE